MSKENESNQSTENTEVELDESAMLDAMDEGIAEVSPEPEGTDDGDNTDDDTGTDAGNSEEPEGEGTSDEADAGDTGDGDTNEADADSGDSADSDAEDDSGDGDGEGEGDGDEVSGKSKDQSDDESDQATEPDHINDPIPESTNDKTKARITGLIDIAKQQTTRGDQGQEIIDAITHTGADPEQFTNTLGFLQLYNSKDPKSRAQALEVARGVVHELSVELGQGSPDLLAQHDDLQAEVEEGKLTEKRAIEIATNRARTKLQNSRAEATQTQEDQTRETNRLIQTGKDQLTAFENTVKTDPAYTVLYPTFRGILATTLHGTDPNTWGATAKSVYENLKAGYTPAAVTPDPKPKPTKQPLRAKQGAGGSGSQGKEPSSGVEAVSAALEGL